MNGKFLILTGISVVSFGIYYYYNSYTKDPNLKAQINAMKSVKYTNIDNLMANKKNSEYLKSNENNIDNINYNRINLSSNMIEDDNLNIKEPYKLNKHGGYYNNKYY